MLESFQEFLEIDKGWGDYILVADGSCTSSTVGYGWSLALADIASQRIHSFCGAGISGTNQLAELLPFLHGLWWVEQHKRKQHPKSLNIVCVSDSEVTVRCGNKEYNRGYSPAYWATISWYETNGYRFHWIWKPRNSVPLMARMDEIAGRARLALENFHGKEYQEQDRRSSRQGSPRAQPGLSA